MDRVPKAALLTVAGGVLLAVSLFMPWFEFAGGETFYAPADEATDVQSLPGERRNAWQAFGWADIVITIAAAFAIVGSVVAARIPGGWGWLIGAIGGCGVAAGVSYAVHRPSDPLLIEFGAVGPGYFVAGFGALLIAAGGVLGAAVADRE